MIEIGIETEITTKRSEIVGTIGMMVKTRGLVERLQGIETQLAASPSSENLGKQYAAVRDADLKLQADDAGGQYQTNYGYVFAVLTMASVPVVAMYLLFSKWFIKGMTEGSLKG